MSGAIPLLLLCAFMDSIKTTVLFTTENDRYTESNNVTEGQNKYIPEVLWHCVTVTVQVNLILLYVKCSFYYFVL
jgi:hypothetical protein